MEANELRIGNYYNQFGYTHQATGSTISELEKAPESQLWCKPIPLDESWLIRAGFEITYSSNFRLKFDHPINTECGFDYSHVADKSMEGFRYFGNYIKIEYVHQLQNLFYCLVGTELQFAEE